ncbi:hypothetical protein PR202_ga25548 [Eleusine coracana subsp. coracana]|uniref:Reverse transcriptase zinc-binding domain-containing protein n=1 Tax=Eleusine coracana subsp. coracana TaxID=191504 RepID=A0AAV5DBA9_ELECO|nr:hypothetical protein PR202_ga25548 [Eleusine coracana subsp. coracana]
MDAIRRSFFWSGERKTTGASCLVSWDKVTRPREHGGLGVRDLKVQNDCLLLKLIHRLHTATDSSWATWVREHADISSMEGDIAGTHWAKLQPLLPLYQAITTVKIGNGTTTSFWHDAWLDIGRLADAFPALASHAISTKASVATVLAAGVRSQLIPRLSRAATLELFAVDDFAVDDLISGTDLSDQRDIRCSELLKPDGTLSTAALYKLVKFVWHNRAPPKVQFFAWLVVQDRIQCKKHLMTKNIIDNNACDLCATGIEDTHHVLFGCSFARNFWDAVGADLSAASTTTPWTIEWPASVPAKHRDCLTLLCFWQLWKHRNGVIFRAEVPSLQRLFALCREEANLVALQV